MPEGVARLFALPVPSPQWSTRQCPTRQGSSRPSGPRLAALLLGLLLLGLPGSLAAQPAPTVSHRVGMFLSDLHGFNFAAGTFGATLWIWSVGPDAARVMRWMEFANADRISSQLESTVTRNGQLWTQRKVVGSFRTSWDLSRFPFDRHTLVILLEEGFEEQDRFDYVADMANSGHAPLGTIAGWRVADVRVAATPAVYSTNFGDPAATERGSRFSRLGISIDLVRVDYSGFLKLTAALYAGFLVCAICSLVPCNASSFAPRVTLLVATLFAIVVNMRTASAALGGEHGTTLIDELHIAGLVYLVTIAGISAWARVRHGFTPEDRGLLAFPDVRACLLAAIGFVGANLVLLGVAAASG